MKSSFWLKFFFLLKTGLILLVFFMLYQLPGQVLLFWGGYEIEIALGVLAVGAFVGLLFILMADRGYIFLMNLPKRWRLRRQERRQMKADQTLLEGFNALAAEEYQEANNLADKSERYDSANPLQLLLKTQVALALGDHVMAENTLEKLREHPKAQFLGLRGLIQVADSRHDHHRTHQLLVDALKIRPESPWVLQRLFDWDLRHAYFDQAETILEQLGAIQGEDKQKLARQKALLAWAEAEVAYREQDFEAFYEAVHRALAFAPDLMEASFRLAQYYGESNRLSKANKTLYQGYTAQPNPDYGVILQQVNGHLTALELYQTAEQMTQTHPYHRYTQQILGRFAINAKLWGQAKIHLEKLKKLAPTKAYYQLVAHLDSVQHPDQPSLVHQWTEQGNKAPADPLWKCKSCSHITERWLLFCPSCSSLDSMVWSEGDEDFSAKPLITYHTFGSS